MSLLCKYIINARTLLVTKFLMNTLVFAYDHTVYTDLLSSFLYYSVLLKKVTLGY